VMWGNRIFLTGADAERQEVYCFERSSGRLVWTATVPRRKPPPGPDDDPETTEETGHAAPTPATDGERVYAFFASGDLAAVDYDAGIVWAKNMGAPESFYGIATSPLVHDGRVILQYDRGDDAEADKSALLALDPRTGDVLWRTPRPVVNSWSSPVVARTGGGERIIAVADPFLIAYDAATGAEKWRARTVTGDVAPCPVVAGGRVYVTNEYSDAMAVRLGGEGDVTESHVAWRNMDSQQSDAASPVCDGRFFFQVHSSGTATCHDAADGRVLWEREFTREDDEGEDVPEVFWASPTLVGDLVYLPAKKGRTYVFRLGAQYEEVGFGALDEETYATPAFGDGRIYVRTVDHLFCIGKPDEKPEEATAD